MKEINLNLRSKTNSGILFLFEKIIRSHPLIYFVARNIIRYTNIFEEDALGVKFLKFKNQINIIDVGASDGISAKFFLNNLDVKKIICYEPYRNYIKKIKKNKNKKINIKPYAIGEKKQNLDVYFPRYNFFGINLDLITYTYYNKKSLIKQIDLDFKFKKRIQVIKTKLKINRFVMPKQKIDLIKIDVNGFELSIIKTMFKCIKRDRPTILLETGADIKKIKVLLKTLSYKDLRFDVKLSKFQNIYKNHYPLNTYFIYNFDNM